VTEWNPTFAGVALDLGLSLEVCWPYRPQKKGSVENLVGWVKGSFLQTAPLSRSGGSGAGAAGVAH
jgi:transposase